MKEPCLTNLEESRVDDVEDAVDGEAGLGDVGGHDDLPLPLGRVLEDLALRLEGHGRVHGQHHELALPGGALLDHSGGEKFQLSLHYTVGGDRDVEMIGY